jgi:dTDP-glucose 4,6-dehydratase
MLKNIVEQYRITDVIQLAAESYPECYIGSPLDFVLAIVNGTVNLLSTAKDFCKRDLNYENAYHIPWGAKSDHLFYHICTVMYMVVQKK